MGDTPATDTSPTVGGSNPASTASSVLLPHPEGPMIDTKPPLGTDRLTSFSTRFTRPATVKSTQMPRATICGACGGVLDDALMNGRELPSRSAGRGGLLKCGTCLQRSEPRLRLRQRGQA